MLFYSLTPLARFDCGGLTPAFSGAAYGIESTDENRATRPPLQRLVRPPFVTLFISLPLPRAVYPLALLSLIVFGLRLQLFSARRLLCFRLLLLDVLL